MVQSLQSQLADCESQYMKKLREVQVGYPPQSLAFLLTAKTGGGEGLGTRMVGEVYPVVTHLFLL